MFSRMSTFWMAVSFAIWTINVGIYLRVAFLTPVTNLSPGYAAFLCLLGAMCLGVWAAYCFVLTQRLRARW